MINSDRAAFADALRGVYALYRVEISAQVIEVWWRALRAYDLKAIADALGRHCVNPDAGQYIPKPADVVKMLGGSTLDSALVALSKLEDAMSSVGAYMTVAFDDALIHAIVDQMGGWPGLCQTKAKDWEFRRTEFLNRYRGHRARSERPPYPSKLLGISDGENASKGFQAGDENLRLIGEVEEARRIIAGGVDRTRIGVTLGEALPKIERKP